MSTKDPVDMETIRRNIKTICDFDDARKSMLQLADVVEQSAMEDETVAEISSKVDDMNDRISVIELAVGKKGKSISLPSDSKLSDPKLRKLIEVCLDFVNDTSRDRRCVEARRFTISMGLIEYLGELVERDADTGKLIIDE
jgi:hypothetical protein